VPDIVKWLSAALYSAFKLFHIEQVFPAMRNYFIEVDVMELSSNHIIC